MSSPVRKHRRILIIMRKPVAGKRERRFIFLIHQRRIPVTMVIPPGRRGTEMAMAEVMETMEMAEMKVVRKPLASRCRHRFLRQNRL